MSFSIDGAGHTCRPAARRTPEMKFLDVIPKETSQEILKILESLKVGGGGGDPPRVCVSEPRPRNSRNPGPAGLAHWPKAWRTSPQLLNTVSRGQFGQCPSMGMRENHEIREIPEIHGIRRKSVDFLEKWRMAASEQCWWCLQPGFLCTITCPRHTCQQAACRTAT